VLAALALSFANESAELFPRATFAVDADGPSITLPKSGTGQPRILAGADDTQHLSLGDRIARLKANRWIEVHVERLGVLTLRPGERMRALWPTS
jgi:hypothetical protein